MTPPPRPRPVRLWACLPAAAGLAVLLAGSGAARAQDDNAAAIEKVTKLNKRGVDEYQNLNFDQARKILQDALDACGEAGLDKHPVAARTLVHMGVVSFAGFKQRDLAVKQFRKALDIQPDIKLDKLLATPEIQEVFDEAASAKSEAGGGGEGAAAGGGEGKATEPITHEPVTKGRQGQPITIKATIDPSLHAEKVVLSFSADGADDFTERPMTEDPPGTWSTQIPAASTTGSRIDYYIDAIGADDKVVASKGSAQNTMQIALVGVGTGAGGKPKKPEPTEGGEGATWFFGLGVGSGIGWTTGKGEVNNLDSVNPTGFAPSKLLHLAPEVGYFLDPNWMLSVQLRVQFVTGATPFYAGGTACGGDGICSPASYALAGFARSSWFFGSGDLRPYAVGTVGFGAIRHVAEFKSQVDCGPNHDQTCIDTVAAGPVFVGGGGGILYDITPAFALTAGANALLGFTTFTFHVDINVGAAFMY